MTNSATETIESAGPELITQAEVARRLGRSKEWVRQQRDSNHTLRFVDFPAPYKVENKRGVMYDAREVEQWRERQRVEVKARRSVNGDTSSGVVPDELTQLVPLRLLLDRNTGRCTEVYHHRVRGGKPRAYSYYMDQPDSLVRRLRAPCDEDGSDTITMIEWQNRTRLGAYGQTPLDRNDLLNRQPKFPTREALDDHRCHSPIYGELDTHLGYISPVREVAALAVTQAIHGDTPEIKCTVSELLALCKDDFEPPICGGQEVHIGGREATIGELVRERRTMDDPFDRTGSPEEEAAADAEWLRLALTTPWHVEALADAGVLCRVSGDDVYLVFTDPAEPHRKRRELQLEGV